MLRPRITITSTLLLKPSPISLMSMPIKIILSPIIRWDSSSGAPTMITSTKLSSTAFGQPHQKTKQNLNNFGKNISKIKHKSIFSSVLSNQECSKVSLVSYLITMRKHSPSGGKITHSSSKDSSLSNGFTLRTSTISTSMASTTWIMRRWSSPKTAITLIHKLLIKCLRSIKKDL